MLILMGFFGVEGVIKARKPTSSAYRSPSAPLALILAYPIPPSFNHQGER